MVCDNYDPEEFDADDDWEDDDDDLEDLLDEAVVEEDFEEFEDLIGDSDEPL